MVFVHSCCVIPPGGNDQSISLISEEGPRARRDSGEQKCICVYFQHYHLAPSSPTSPTSSPSSLSPQPPSTKYIYVGLIAKLPANIRTTLCHFIAQSPYSVGPIIFSILKECLIVVNNLPTQWFSVKDYFVLRRHW